MVGHRKAKSKRQEEDVNMILGTYINTQEVSMGRKCHHR